MATRMSSCSGCRDGAAFETAFSMAFQPIVDLPARRVFAYEALVRGPAGEPAAVVLDQVTRESRYAFDQACRVKALQTAVAAGIVATGAKLSINFLPNAVYSPMACIQLTLATAAQTGFPPDRLIFEFTENEEMGSPEHVEAIIDTYRKIGFSVAIDDFGAGYSGLGRFARFRPDLIKLDMDLIRGVDGDPRRSAVIAATVGMCAALDTVLIAEGVETVAEAATLDRLGIRFMQGYLFARPAFETLPEAGFPD
jgi:EAL domain-containing protein (putative c-di-GMP-specific phosphodiesterase class I)